MSDQNPASEPAVFPLPQDNSAVTDFLKNRRSNMSKFMTGPGPDRAQLDGLLEIAARVPDHRKLGPWRFIVMEGQAREDFGKYIASAFMADNPNMPIDRTVFEGARLMRAPTVVAVISSPVDCPRGTPEWEQVLSSGGFAYDARLNDKLGLNPREKVAGYIYIGTTNTPSSERARPNVADRLEFWSPP